MEIVKHYGTPRKSGRYPWGSGDNAYQRGTSFLGMVDKLKKEGLSEVEIARGLGMSTKELRERKSIANAAKRAADASTALRLKEKGYSTSAIARRMGKNESSIRSLLDPALNEKAKIMAVTSEVLKNAIGNKQFIDVGVGVEQHLGISRTKLNTAVKMLEDEGYQIYYVKVRQLGTDKYTSIKVLAPPDASYSDLSKDPSQIKLPHDYSIDNGRSYLGIEPVRSVNGDRIYIRYAEDGGLDKDGLIELRSGVDDISLGDSSYAQVRVGVDGTHFMKGMAMYSHDVPVGYDIVYNTAKTKGTPSGEVYKLMKDDPDNPFGSTLRQKHYIDADGNKQLSALNIVGSVPGAGEEGSWETWSKNLSSQILSKQTPALAKKQLDLAFSLKKEEFDEIMSLTNPSVRQKLLKTFSDDVDSATVHLKAAALPGQVSQVLLPFKSIKPNEVYAPNFDNGDNVALLRHPHGGIFEIPELRVNNRNQEARSLIGPSAKDAIGINPEVAKRLSGADFDGDTVIVIPNKNRLIRTSSPLQGLRNFDPQTAYPKYDGMKVMPENIKQLEMGKISNLITDMTIKGANHNEIARAVRHSMVVIDAEKHELNYKQSHLDNNIAGLKEKYQGGAYRGAATLISKAGSPKRVPHRMEGKYIKDPKTGKKKRVYIDPKTGKKLYEETGETYINKKGKLVKRTTKTTRIAEESDAHKLASGTVMETIYANHANQLKTLANKARRRMISTKAIPYSRSARKTFADQVESLKSKLALAIRNKPFERQAQLLANKVVTAKRKANPDMTPDDLKKIKGQALEEARRRVGAKKVPIEIKDREWQAIQAGAISPSRLSKILDNIETDKLKERALPRTNKLMSSTKTIRAQTMLATGYTRAEVAAALGVSVSTLARAIDE